MTSRKYPDILNLLRILSVERRQSGGGKEREVELEEERRRKEGRWRYENNTSTGRKVTVEQNFHQNTTIFLCLQSSLL